MGQPPAGSDDPWRAWARFRDDFEAERARICGLIETARAALAAPDPPLEALRETLQLAEEELGRLDAAIAAVHAQLIALQLLLAAGAGLLN